MNFKYVKEIDPQCITVEAIAKLLWFPFWKLSRARFLCEMGVKQGHFESFLHNNKICYRLKPKS